MSMKNMCALLHEQGQSISAIMAELDRSFYWVQLRVKNPYLGADDNLAPAYALFSRQEAWAWFGSVSCCKEARMHRGTYILALSKLCGRKPMTVIGKLFSVVGKQGSMMDDVRYAEKFEALIEEKLNQFYGNSSPKKNANLFA